MAAKTPSSVNSYNMGALTLSIASFTDIDSGDTYATGLPNAIAYWANGTDVPSITDEGVGVSVSNNTATFTTGEANRTVDFYLLTRT